VAGREKADAQSERCRAKQGGGSDKPDLEGLEADLNQVAGNRMAAKPSPKPRAARAA